MLLTMGEFMQFVVPKIPGLRFDTEQSCPLCIVEEDHKQYVTAGDLVRIIGIQALDAIVTAVEQDADRQSDQEALDALDETRENTDEA